MKNLQKTLLSVVFMACATTPIFAQEGHFYTTQEELLPKKETAKFLYHNGFQITATNIYNKPENVYMVFVAGPLLPVETAESKEGTTKYPNYKRQIFAAEMRLEGDYKLTIIKVESITNTPNLIADAQLESVLLEAVLHAKNIRDAAVKNKEK